MGLQGSTSGRCTRETQVSHIGCGVKHRPDQWGIRCSASDIADAQPEVVNVFLPMHSKRISSKLSQGTTMVRGSLPPREIWRCTPSSTLVIMLLAFIMVPEPHLTAIAEDGSTNAWNMLHLQ